ncbi:MAG: hypothetical protein PHY45_02460 [Rhodocyclaceae bacterium]|nr:hypothetical protein [Rhodocyclaceae bacterium]
MAEGTAIKLGGQVFTLSAVPVVGIKAIGLDNLKLIGMGISDQSIDALIGAVYYGLKRNHADMTREFVEMNIDALNMEEIVSAFAAVNRPKTAQEGAPGEA